MEVGTGISVTMRYGYKVQHHMITSLSDDDSEVPVAIVEVHRSLTDNFCTISC